MKKLSRKLQSIESLEYADYTEWKKDFDDEAKVDYEALFEPFLNAKRLTVKGVRQIFDLNSLYRLRIGRLHMWAKIDYEKVVRRLPAAENQHPFVLLTNRFNRYSEVYERAHLKILSLSETRLNKLLRSKMLRKHVSEIKVLIRFRDHIPPPEKRAAIVASQAPLDALAHSFSFLKRRAIGGLSFFRESTVAQLGRMLQQRYEIAKACNYGSCLEAEFFLRNIPPSLYISFIGYVRSHVEKLHRYVEIVKIARRVESVDPLFFFVPRQIKSTSKTSLDEAISLSVLACAPLGSMYADTLYAGVTKHHWMVASEFRESEFKGRAYSAPGAPIKFFARFNETLDSVFTLVHELGHCMHHFLSANQSRYSRECGDPIIIETVGRFNEQLLWHALLQACDNPARHAYLCSKRLNFQCCQVFNACLYAELDLFLHETIERGESLSSGAVMGKFSDLVRFYYGKNIKITEAFLWAHCIRRSIFSNPPFHSYTVAINITASIALAERVLHSGRIERDQYLNALKQGPGKNPIDLLLQAGADIASRQFVDRAMKSFEPLMGIVEKFLVSRKSTKSPQEHSVKN